MRNILFILSLLISFISINAQGQRTLENSITGKVLDKNAKVPLEYSNIVLFQVSDSTQANGTITNSEGIFRIEKIRPGNYYIRISFIGYES
ncbi:MAG: carboxypeptidase regulatory-like domain-containing protein, partial [Ignavibacteriae bacterium]|nr:carboxypeptidase regulatory-like domain-containing protein [Ignavibacteriota bacterium]